MATTGSREARRRRIMERGSDRLALITGRIQSLTPDSDQSPRILNTTDQNPAVDMSSATTDFSQPEDHSMPNETSLGQLNWAKNAGPETVQHLHNGVNGKRIPSTSATITHSMDEQDLLLSASVQNSVRDHQHRYQSFHKSFTIGQINSAISASENVRLCCAVAAAILVILSHARLPILGWGIIRSTILFGPLYLLLLTNVSIVLLWLILGKPREEVKTGQVRRVALSSGENNLIDHVGNALESGLLLQKIFSALFMDSSVYWVWLVCGLSLVKII